MSFASLFWTAGEAMPVLRPALPVFFFPPALDLAAGLGLAAFFFFPFPAVMNGVLEGAGLVFGFARVLAFAALPVPLPAFLLFLDGAADRFFLPGMDSPSGPCSADADSATSVGKEAGSTGRTTGEGGVGGRCDSAFQSVTVVSDESDAWLEKSGSGSRSGDDCGG